MKQSFLFITLLCSTLIAVLPKAEAQSKSCADLKTGEYYYYPRNSLEQCHIIMSGDFEKVVDLVKHKGSSYYDSCVYKVDWKNDCDYTLKYVQGCGLSDADLRFVTRHKLAYHVDTIGSEYYVFTSYEDRVSSGTLLGKDTMWLHPQTRFADSRLFELIDPNKIRKLHFSDTSRMALLYIYRPGKLKLSLAELFLYYNDLPIVVLKNKSAAVVAVFKEGPFTLRSRVSATKVEGDLPMDIKFGQTYYIRADMIWGLYKTGNTKLAFTPMDPKEGKQDFDSIYQE